GKVAGLPLYRLLGGGTCADLPAYASLLRYGRADAVAFYTEQALKRGYRDIKLHEITVPEVTAAREVAGADARIMLGTNCPSPPSPRRSASPSSRTRRTSVPACSPRSTVSPRCPVRRWSSASTATSRGTRSATPSTPSTVAFPCRRGRGSAWTLIRGCCRLADS